MATDPFRNDEERRRYEELMSYPNVPRTELRGYSQTPAPAPARTAGSLARTPAPRTTTPAPRPRAQFSDDGPSVDSATDRRAAGLTRVFKTRDARGNSVYTDQPIRGGETRYYGATGMRADAEFDPRTGRDVAFDANTQPGRDRLFANADTQRRSLGRMLADADAVREGRDPSNPQGLQWEQTENGPRVTTAAERAAAAKGRGAGGSGMSIGDQVALLRLQRDINRDTATDTRNAQLDERAQRAQDETLRQNLLKNVREDPGTLINTRLGGLFGRDLSNPEDLAALDEFFNSEEGRVISNELTERFRRTNREGNLAFGLGMTSNPTFADLRPSRAPGLSGRYVVEGDELFGAQLAPEDLGLSAESLDLLTRYYARRRAQNDR